MQFQTYLIKNQIDLNRIHYMKSGNNFSKSLKRVLELLIISFVLIAFVWVMIAKSESYSEPHEALWSKDSDLVLIQS
ncbi:hypothetical protein ACNA06_06935 [Lysinibacillus sp. RSDA_15]|uniref:hypothetical protein n=2 Tax=Bacillaceae TaxID=186817 RepID=UPI003A4DDDAD